MSHQFEKAWHDLNVRLNTLERERGLVPALQELQNHHLKNGFIKDTLKQVDRRSYSHPNDPTRFFRVQYNPGRALRFAGAGRKDASASIFQNGCFLCRDNIEWQQHGVQLGYQVETGGREFTALTNPFPILPGHIVMASSEHRTQEWRFRDANGLDVVELIDDLVCMADRMPGYLGFYNGVDAGASIPGHLHYQFVKRPPEQDIFPLEAAVRQNGKGEDGPSLSEHYPLDVAIWRGSAADVIARASDWMTQWGERNSARLEGLSANFIAVRNCDDDQVTLYFVPRDRSKALVEGYASLAGGIETLGEIVLTSPRAAEHLSNGSISYAKLETALGSLRTPLDVE